MRPKTFYDEWKLTREELAMLTGRSVTTVNHWLLDPENDSHRDAPKQIKDFLTFVHIIWTLQSLMDKFLPRHIMVVYDMVKHRKGEDD